MAIQHVMRIKAKKYYRKFDTYHNKCLQCSSQYKAHSNYPKEHLLNLCQQLSFFPQWVYQSVTVPTKMFS